MSDSTRPHSDGYGMDVHEMDAALVRFVEVIGLHVIGIGDG